MTIENLKPIPPFKRWTLENFPFIEDDFDAITNYQLYCKIVEYLKKIANNQNGLDETVNNLINYVNNYFENLDVQEEINNKLDEMASDGTLENIITSYINLKSILCFDTVSDMKAATNLSNGCFVKTYGFYNTYDNGGALYKIRNITNDDVVDEAFIIALDDEDLVAEIVLEDGMIYANRLGADSTGTNDSSSVINTAFQKINEYWVAGKRINTLVLNGTYKIDNQLVMPACAKLTSNGLVKIISTVINNSTLHIRYLNSTLPSSNVAKQRYMIGDMIDFKSGCIFSYAGDKDTDNVIGIEIGDRSNLGSDYSVCRYNIKNISINNFTVGILHNSYNVYLGSYDHLQLENNTTNIKFGLSSQVGTWANAGERMSFTNCTIGSSTTAVDFASIYWYAYFVNCSFDFNTNVFYQTNVGAYGNSVRVSDSHFEYFTNIVRDFTSNQELVNICNSMILNTNNSVTPFNNSDNTYITLDNTIYHYSSPSSYSPSNFLILNGTPVLNNTKLLRTSVNEQVFIKNNLYNSLDSLEDGSISITEGNYIGDFKVTGYSGLEATATVVTDNYLYTGHKSVVLTRSSSANNPVLYLESDFIPLTDEKLIFNSLLLYNMKNQTTRALIKFYDQNQNEVKYKSSYEWYPTTIAADTWIILPFGNFDTVPANARFFKTFITIPNMSAGTTDPASTQYKIGGIFGNAR